MASEKILIVEDDGILAAHLEDVLAALGYRPLPPVASAEAALAAATTLQPDLVLMDIELSGEASGIVAAEQIRACVEVPIIFVTGYSNDPLLQQAKTAVPYGYLIKPVPERELAATIELALHRHALDRRLRASEAALRASEERYRRLVENLNEGIWEIDAAGVTTFVNPKLTELLGYSPEEMLGRHLFSFIRPEAIADCQEKLARRAAGVREQHDFEFLRKDGSVMVARLETSPILDEAGRHVGAIAGVADITDRKRAEEALARSRDELHAVYDSAPVMMCVLDAERAVRYVNAAFVEYVGRPAGELRGERACGVLGCAHASDDPRGCGFGPSCPACALRRGLEAALAEGTISRGVEQRASLRRTDGHQDEVVFLAAMAPLRADGERSVLLCLEDITERRRAEEALRASEERYRRVVQHAREAIVVAQDGVLKLANPASEALTGLPAAVLASRPFTEMIHPDDRALVVSRHLSRLRGEGGPLRYCFRVVRPSGEVRSVEISGAVCIDWEGRPATLNFLTDITDRRRAEEERASLEAQLHHAMKMEAMGRLAGGVAHDFNNLLTTISGNTLLALEDLPAGHPVRDLLEDVGHAATSAASLTRQLLAFSRKQVIEPRFLDLNQQLQQLERMLRRLIGEDIELETRLTAGLPALRADPGQLEQVLVNLAVNARDAMPDGGRLCLATAQVLLDEAAGAARGLPAGRYLQLTVTDTGRGMTEEVQRRLFEPFFTTKAKEQGTGLGLATTYGAVRQAGGLIEVESSPGAGSAFRILLPAVEEAPEAVVTVDAGSRQRGGGTILLVEDEPAVRAIAGRILRRAGYDVLEASNGAEACQVAGAHESIDLLITDVVMPGMNGRELATRLGRPGLAVLFTSGYIDDVLADRDLAAAGHSFLAKPYPPAVLLEKVEAALAGRR